MRDSKRIPKMIKEIERVWKKHPDLRFMQLLGNVFRADSYYMEDEDMLRFLKDYYKEK